MADVAAVTKRRRGFNQLATDIEDILWRFGWTTTALKGNLLWEIDLQISYILRVISDQSAADTW